MDGAPLDESVTHRVERDANTGSGMSMADDHTLGSYRSTDPQRRASEPARPNEQAGSGDPLAELARLIGQSDPFAEFGRSSRRAARQGQAQGQVQAASAAAAEQRYAPAQEQQFAADDAHGRDDYGADPYGAHADYAHPPAHAGEERLPAGHVYDEVPLAADHQGQYHHEQGQHHHDDQLHQSQQYASEQQDGYDADQYYEDEASLDPHDEEMYDDPPPARGRSGLTTALALVGCALLGTVAAYAYRSYTGPAGSMQPPPVITADTSTPTKIVPATAGDPQSGKAVVVNAGKEQLVSKQEEPVALKESAPQPAPRVAAPPAAPAPQPPAGAATAPNEPKKVRTVTIRPDGSDMSARPVGAPPPAAPSAAAPAAPKAAAARSGGPISLDPQGGGEPASATAGRTQTAAAPSRPAPDATSNASGGFVVQLSSQKSESEALSSFRSLQAKFPNELGGRQPIIRRADLGSKGVFYRTLVGPFASAHEASQFCSSYKAAGGQCVVPNN
jgi:SPOR domain